MPPSVDLSRATPGRWVDAAIYEMASRSGGTVVATLSRVDGFWVAGPAAPSAAVNSNVGMTVSAADRCI
jgi:hypothetical protein